MALGSLGHWTIWDTGQSGHWGPGQSGTLDSLGHWTVWDTGQSGTRDTGARDSLTLDSHSVWDTGSLGQSKVWDTGHWTTKRVGLWQVFFTLHCSSSFSSLNDYLAIDSGDISARILFAHKFL